MSAAIAAGEMTSEPSFAVIGSAIGKIVTIQLSGGRR